MARDHVVGIRVSSAERSLLEAAAARENRSLSGYMRDRVLAPLRQEELEQCRSPKLTGESGA